MGTPCSTVVGGRLRPYGRGRLGSSEGLERSCAAPQPARRGQSRWLVARVLRNGSGRRHNNIAFLKNNLAGQNGSRYGALRSYSQVLIGRIIGKVSFPRAK